MEGLFLTATVARLLLNPSLRCGCNLHGSESLRLLLCSAQVEKGKEKNPGKALFHPLIVCLFVRPR